MQFVSSHNKVTDNFQKMSKSRLSYRFQKERSLKIFSNSYTIRELVQKKCQNAKIIQRNQIANGGKCFFPQQREKATETLLDKIEFAYPSVTCSFDIAQRQRTGLEPDCQQDVLWTMCSFAMKHIFFCTS